MIEFLNYQPIEVLIPLRMFHIILLLCVLYLSREFWKSISENGGE